VPSESPDADPAAFPTNPHLSAPRGAAPGSPGFRILLHTPEIPGNTGNVIRLAAITGAELHLVEPVGFDFSDAKLRRAGLDYHDLAVMTVHPNLESAWDALLPARVFAFTARGDKLFTEVEYRPGDVLMFGRESTGLPDEVLADPHVTARIRLPMQPSRRSLNLANSASIAVYEAWRQHGFAGSA
jgi:tRNA (cytidine/uridine-2'-O-)-methyltransferase